MNASAGSLTLAGANTYTGTTTISAGTLTISSTPNNSSNIAIANSANLTFSAGSGTTYTFSNAITGAAGNVAFNVDGNTSASGGGDSTHFVLNNTGAFIGTVVVNTGLVNILADSAFGNSAKRHSTQCRQRR